MTIGERIKKRRFELGLTAEDVANALNIDRATVYRYESKEITKFPTNALGPLSKVLQTTPGYLMGWDDEPENPSLQGDPELAEYLELLRTRPEMRIMFNLTKGATKEDVEKAVKVIEAMFGK